MTRNLRRAALREHLKDYTHGGFNPGNTATAFGLVRDLTDILANKNNPKRAGDAGALVLKVYDKACATYGFRGELACKAGCTYCCHTRVTASGLEVFLLARMIRDRWTDPAAPFKAAFQKTEATTRDQDVDQRNKAQIGCPVLQDNLCAAYQGRPMACRTYASLSLPACIDAFNLVSDRIPKPKQNEAIRAIVLTATKAALHESGLPSDSYELGHALHIALESENAERQWLAGASVFETVARDRRQQEPRTPDAYDLLTNVLRLGAFGKEVPENPWFKWPA